MCETPVMGGRDGVAAETTEAIVHAMPQRVPTRLQIDFNPSTPFTVFPFSYRRRPTPPRRTSTRHLLRKKVGGELQRLSRLRKLEVVPKHVRQRFEHDQSR